MRLTKKTLALLLAMVMLFGGVIGGTVAWLVSTTDTVTNTFTVGNITIELKEHNYDAANNVLLNGEENEVTSIGTYKMIPGRVLPKDPFVRVKAGSEACYIFLKVTETNNDSGMIEFAVDTDWLPYSTSTDNGVKKSVYYREVDARTGTNNSDLLIGILVEGTHSCTVTHDPVITWAENQVLVNPDITKEEMDAVTTNPSLTFKACAVQFENMTDEDAAWAQVPADFKNN